MSYCTQCDAYFELEYDLSDTDFRDPEYCPFCGVEMEYGENED